MTVSTDGQICFGYLLEEGTEFPWDRSPYDGDLENWWCQEVLKYTPPVEIYDENGEHRKDIVVTEQMILDYWHDKHEATKKNPLPIELVNVCSGDYPIFIIAVPSTCFSCNRGFPKPFDPKSLIVSQDEIDGLVRFCKTHNIEVEGKTQWYLSSYWG